MPNRSSRGRGQVSELTHIAPIKLGAVANGVTTLRYADRLRIVLEAFHAREDQGSPSVIRLFRGIHFSQWAMLDGDTRLMLNVVFDGDLHGYLRSLAREVPGMLHTIWSNCEGWEDVHDDADRLIRFIEAHQVHVNFFYAQHPQLTVPDVERLLVVRDAVATPGADAALQLTAASRPRANLSRLRDALKEYGQVERSKRAFVELIGSLYNAAELDRAVREAYGADPLPQPSKPTQALAPDEIQGNVLQPYPDAHCARMLFFHFDDAEAARAWLAALPITFGVADGAHVHWNIGFTHAGLVALGVDAATLSGFPQAFLEGMQQRAKILGDPALEVAPEPRVWTHVGDRAAPVHAVVQLSVKLSAADSALRAALMQAGELAQTCADAPLGASTSPTVDAELTRLLSGKLSAVWDALAPQLRAASGSPRCLGYQDLHQPLVQPGDDPASAYPIEHFGFRDGIGQPRVHENRDPTLQWLTDSVGLETLLRTDASGLLKHGTFLVARQLRQDPDVFWKRMQEQAMARGISAREHAEQTVGRRLDGRRLDSPRSMFDPERDLHAFDPGAAEGGCPFHAHARRANPRIESSPSANPRLMRRSLSYLQQRDGAWARGMMFLAFNADIETQFELIQRRWMQSGNHVGLSSVDRDALVEQVTLEWGMYLFVPSRTGLCSLLTSEQQRLEALHRSLTQQKVSA